MKISSESPRLSMLIVYPTFNCNARCVFCWPDAGPHRLREFPEKLELEDVISAINDAMTLGLERVVITGGEPLLKPDLTFGVVEYTLSRNINVTIETNFLLLHEDMFSKILSIRNKYKNDAILQLAPTVLSLREDIFNKLMGVRAYDVIFKRLRKYVRIARNIDNLVIGAAITVLKDNLDEALDLGEYLLSEVQVHSIKFNPVVELGRFRREAIGHGLSPQDLIKLAHIVTNLNKRYPRRVSSSLPFCLVYDIGPNFCPYDRVASIMPDGSISICINFVIKSDGSKDPSAIAGNIKYQRLKEIFLRSSLFEMIRNLRRESPYEGICSKCVFRKYCAPGCIAYAYRYYGRITAPNPMCQRLYEMNLFPRELIL